MAKSKNKVSELGSVEVQNPNRSDQGSRVLTPVQYYEWRLAIEKFMHAKTKFDLEQKKFSFNALQIENEKLKLELYKQHVKQFEQLKNLAEEEYTSVRMKLENQLGFELKDKLIDEITFEIKEA